MKTENAMAAMGLRCSDCVYFERDGNGDSGVCLTDVAFINVNAGDGVCGAFTQIGCANASEMSVVKRLRAQYMSKANRQAVQTIKKGHSAMKIFMTVVLSLWANLSFALTETIDGVTWTFYVTNGYAVLEHPQLRTSGGGLPHCHKGNLPQTLQLPESLGGYSVTNLGVISIGLDSECGVDTIVVPSSYKSISDCAIVGPNKDNSTTDSGTLHNWYTMESIGCTNILFFGDCPMVDHAAYVIEKWGYRSYQDHYLRYYKNDYHYPGWYTCGQFRGCNCYIVEGTEGWTVGQTFCDGVVKYGAARVSMVEGNISCKYTHVFTSDDNYVTLRCTNPRAAIYYTLDGTEPTISSLVYTHQIPAGKYIVKAIAVVPEYPYTVTETCSFALGQTVVPTISTDGGNVFYLSGKVVSLSTETDGAEIRYTLDGSEPTENSKLYTKPFTIDDTTTIKAKAFKTDWFDSETATATFTREWYIVETPVIEPTEAEFANESQEVSIACATDGAAIYYTTDGSDPAQNGLEYKRPFTIYKSCIVKAIAKKYDWKNSAEATVTFTRTEGLSEASNLFGYTMESDENAPWVVDSDMSHDGVSSVRSGTIGNNGVTTLSVSLRKTGTVSFWWRAKCEDAEEEGGETYYYDYGSFAVDGNVVARIAGNDTGWQYVSHEIATGGKHVLSWEYRKDGATSYAPDCVWVDQVQWIPADGSGYTLTTPEPVPYSWLDQYNLGVGTDYETAGNAASGKMNWGKPSAVWEEYVAGLDPTDANSRLVANIGLTNGVPYISWTPDLNTNGIIRTYKIYGSETLENGGNWQYPTNSLHRFFRVKVEMP